MSEALFAVLVYYIGSGIGTCLLVTFLAFCGMKMQGDEWTGRDSLMAVSIIFIWPYVFYLLFRGKDYGVKNKKDGDDG